MAEKVKSEDKTDKKAEKPKKRIGRFFKWLLILLILLVITAAAFALGVYLKVFNMNNLITKLNLNKYPVVGQYFPQPKTNFEPVPLDQQSTSQTPVNTPPQVSPDVQQAPSVLPADPSAGAPVPVDNTELLKQAKLKQLEDARRISKAAKLYDGMKPDEAVLILNKLDDNTVIEIFSKMDESQVSKIMALLDPGRAATLTQLMLRGQKTN